MISPLSVSLKYSKAQAISNRVILNCWQPESIWNLHVEYMAQEIRPEVIPMEEPKFKQDLCTEWSANAQCDFLFLEPELLKNARKQVKL